jgi:hypothetical protein
MRDFSALYVRFGSKADVAPCLDCVFLSLHFLFQDLTQYQE